MTVAKAKPTIRATEKDPMSNRLLTARGTSVAERRDCVLQAASRATDADDLRHLLDVLGLPATDGRPPAQAPTP